MRLHYHRFARWLAAGLLLVSGAVDAAPALRDDMVKSLEGLQARLENGDPAALRRDAEAAAERLEGGNAADRWARALFLQIAATAAAEQGKDARAADLFAEARGVDGIESRYRRRWLQQEARLRLRAGQTDKGAELLGRWLESGQGEAADYWLMAQAQAELERWKRAAEWVDRARRAGGIPARWQSLAAAVYQRAGRDQAALEVIDGWLAGDDVPAEAWRRAAGLAQRLDQPGRAAAIWEAGWRRGALSGEDDLRRLIELHLAGGTPARAAEHLVAALEQGRLPDDLEERRLLARAWSAARARDKALAAWREVAERSRAGDDWRRLGELAYGWGRWQTAVDALRQARETGEAQPRDWLLEGVAAFEQGDIGAARQAFAAARDAGAEQARAWLTVLDDGAQGDGAQNEASGG
ncbi:tetratricopeptide repeat protein [Modicisalibacter coralii]|uniref:tetratricopeptide repeat protein n=1 Tax=Modicisalibacter coralii TaxID=2304602 RepID=UPI00100BEE6A|nr:hypothetical protein [Halomonas coralii]